MLRIQKPIGRALGHNIHGLRVDRPQAVLVIAGTLSLAAAIAAITGFSLLFPNAIWDRMWALNRPAYVAFTRFGMFSGAGLLALAGLAAATAIGLLGRMKWGWWAAVVLFAVNGLGDLITLTVTHDLARSGSGVLIALFFLYLLTRTEVRAHFTGDVRI